MNKIKMQNRNIKHKFERKRKIQAAILGAAALFLLLNASIVWFYSVEAKHPDAFIHLSFDDTISIFMDITEHKEDYQSIFENDTLGFLQSMHNDWGGVFSFYCFYETDGFSLSDCTDKFAKDFQDNAGWLKFGFHSLNSEESLQYADAQKAVWEYEKTVKELLRITGSAECIDTAPRLHLYAATLESVNALLGAEHGIEGLLAADDERESYYFNEAESNYLLAHDSIKDENGLSFFTTDLRLENTGNPYGDLVLISKQPDRNKVIEIFTHEWLMGLKTKAKIYAVCVFAYKYGYVWDYPMNRVSDHFK